MLDKIININSNFQFKGGGSHSAGFEKFLNGVIAQRVNLNDSIKFSPMAQYLARINCQLKNISFSSKTSVKIEFMLDGFDFSTELDIINYFKDNRQLYNIFRTIETGVFTSKNLLRISAKKSKLVISDNIQEIKLRGLYRLFEKASMIEGDPNKHNETLPEGLRAELSDEFEFINVVIYNLINKLGTIKVPETIIFHEDDTELVIIEKITTLHDKRFSE